MSLSDALFVQQVTVGFSKSEMAHLRECRWLLQRRVALCSGGVERQLHLGFHARAEVLLPSLLLPCARLLEPDQAAQPCRRVHMPLLAGFLFD